VGMRLLVSSVVVVLGCSSSGDGGGSGVAVVDLTDQEQTDLCEAFLNDLCVDSDFCDDPCINSACVPAVQNGDVDGQCGLATDGQPITDDDVLDCAAGSQSACDFGGDCMIDALEAACAGN
jgi:hypothetical protein